MPSLNKAHSNKKTCNAGQRPPGSPGDASDAGCGDKQAKIVYRGPRASAFAFKISSLTSLVCLANLAPKAYRGGADNKALARRKLGRAGPRPVSLGRPEFL